MTDQILVLAWLVLAHLAADFVLQTGRIVRAKNGRGATAAGGLLAHGLIVAVTLVPFGLAYGGPGWALLAWSAGLHVVIDWAKIGLTRRAAGRALADARARHEDPQPADHLGRAWTAAPAALFIADQLAHLGVLALGWSIFLLAGRDLQPGWLDAVNAVFGSVDRTGIHRVVGVGLVIAILAIVNIRAASIFVAILVRPVEEAEGEPRWGARADPAVSATATSATRSADPMGRPEPARHWSVRIGPFQGLIDARPEPPGANVPAAGPAMSARVGATIGILERILIVVFVLTGADVAIGFVVAAKTLARFRQLDDREFAEYYLLGTLGSVSVAIVTALVGRAAIATLLG